MYLPSTVTGDWRLQLWFITVLNLLANDVAVTTATTGGIQFCSPDEPLLNHNHFIPLLEFHRPVLNGCISKERSDDRNFPVHVFSLRNTTEKQVLLQITEKDPESKGTILVLHSTTIIGWRIQFFGIIPEDFHVEVALSSESFIVESIIPIKRLAKIKTELGLTSSQAQNPRNDVLLRAVKKRYGGVTTFAELENTNRISVLLPSSTNIANNECQLEALPYPEDFAAVHGYFQSLPSVTGCFHGELSGQYKSDVHIIDLMKSGARSPQTENELDPIYLSMLPESENVLRRNVTLILRSSTPVTWFLDSKLIQGFLRVIAQDPGSVIDVSLAKTQSLSVSRETELLSMAYDELWRFAVRETDAVPISYLRLKEGNLLHLIFPSETAAKNTQTAPEPIELLDSHSGLPNESEDAAEKHLIMPGNVINEVISHKTFSEAKEKVEAEIQSKLRKNCGQSKTVLALGKATVKSFNISYFTLNDPQCVSFANATHFVVKSPSTSCGSVNFFSGSNPTFRNNVIFYFSDESPFHRSQIRIPFSCQFRPGLPGLSSPSEEASPADEFDSSLNVVGNMNDFDDELYHIVISRISDDSQRQQILMFRKGESANVSPGDKLLVETEFETTANFNLAVETCWLSSSAFGADSTEAVENIITAGCPSSSNITFTSTSTKQNPSFSFTIRPDHLKHGKIYLHCLIGLCAPERQFLLGNAKECINPREFCSESGRTNKNHNVPVAQQLVTRGPIFIHPYSNHGSYNSNDPSIQENMMFPSPSTTQEKQSDSLTGLHSSHVVMVGVPAEIAVVIALVSFVVGAALTGLLCCIHHRKLSSKSVVVKAPAQNTVESSEMQSMIPSGENHHQHNGNGQVTHSEC